MERKKKIILIYGLLILAIASVSALATSITIYLPFIRSSGNAPSPTFDPCKPVPYPQPTPIGCPTATTPPTPLPYPIPPSPEPSKTPQVTFTPEPQIKNIYLPIIENGLK